LGEIGHPRGSTAPPEHRIYLSGLWSGSSPSPGVGTARSIRLAYPNAWLVGVDYSNQVSGLHWPDFDDIWLQRPWDELNLDEYRDQIRHVLDSGALWISGLDLETVWLARAFRSHPNLLVSPGEALARLRKPPHEAAQRLRFESPPSIPLTEPEWALHAFCRRNGWQVWLKGPYYEARRVDGWSSFKSARHELSQTWSDLAGLYLEAHVSGHEESVALCSIRGDMLASVHMSKRVLTPEGKTWTGRIRPTAQALDDALRALVRDLRWTGGAEIEFVRDGEDRMWLLEWNPRFPAWIHGASVCGANLPARLVEAASGVPAVVGRPAAAEFTRVVLEIPTRSGYPSAPLGTATPAAFVPHGKHPSGMPLLARRLRPEREPPAAPPAELPASILEDLGRIDVGAHESPSWLFLEETAAAQFAYAAEVARTASRPNLKVGIAYSIKTNPDRRVLALARRHGMAAEAISQLEASRALADGFRQEALILNGPGKWWPQGDARVWGGFVFCDSVREMNALDFSACLNGLPSVVGPRLRPPNVASRFGIDVSDQSVLGQLAGAIRALPPHIRVGIQFHIASSAIGTDRWWRVFAGTLEWARALQHLGSRDVDCLDIGGGWFPDDLRSVLGPALESVGQRATQALPHLRTLTVEIGKGLVQPCFALLVRVLEVRGSDQEVDEITVDGSIAELPEFDSYPHRILWFDEAAGRWLPAGAGRARILGRLCMEDDILATHVRLPKGLRPGTALVVCDAGAYDRSMAYEFGRG